MRRPLTSLMLGASLVLAGGVAVGARAQPSPPAPDFASPYGRVTIDGVPLEQPVQPVIAFVNGVACGEGHTRLIAAAPGVDPADIGQVGFVLDVLADGAGPAQRPGCGKPGDSIRFYFPQVSRFAAESPTFRAGFFRVDLSLLPALSERRVVPTLARDGP